MKAVVRLLCVAALAVAYGPVALAGNTHLPTPSVWTLNVAESKFGGGPTEKSDVYTLTVDTDKWMTYKEAWVEGDGKKVSVSWSGPQDGTWKPLAGMPGGKVSVKTADDSFHVMYPDGSKLDSTFVLSADKKKLTYTGEFTMKDGKSYHQAIVFDRTK